ncbi:MAG: hypothetical protein CMJ31_13390 [Phycisphaerae bacterium]|nr:hypothetical protein [Phycisphaerae bacterium]
MTDPRTTARSTSETSLETPDLVIFDCDGVLVDTEPLTLDAMRRWIASCGLDLSYDEVANRYKGTHLSVIQPAVEAEIGRPIDDFVDGYRSLMFKAFEAGVEPIPGVVETLDALDAAGIAMCVASNGPHVKMDASMAASGLADRFGGLKRDGGERIFSADDIATPKPAPDLFLHAAEAMGVAPDRCVVVEDSPSGIVAARAAGMRCVAYVDVTPIEALRAEGPDLIIESMADLPAALGLTSTRR